MSDSFLLFGEAAYLMMLARRTLNYQKAEEHGEEYHDMIPFTRLHCGVGARLRFVKQLETFVPVVEVKYQPNQGNAEEACKIATEIAGTPMTLSLYDPNSAYTLTKKTP